jgi:hypothetical protein
VVLPSPRYKPHVFRLNDKVRSSEWAKRQSPLSNSPYDSPGTPSCSIVPLDCQVNLVAGVCNSLLPTSGSCYYFGRPCSFKFQLPSGACPYPHLTGSRGEYLFEVLQIPLLAFANHDPLSLFRRTYLPNFDCQHDSVEGMRDRNNNDILERRRCHEILALYKARFIS